MTLKRIILAVCILSGLAAVAPPPAAGQGAGDFGSGYGTKFIYRRPFRYDLEPNIFARLSDSLGYWTKDSVRKAITDSLDRIPRTGGGASGRTYVRGPYVDSTGALYSIGFAQDYMAQANFSNSTSGGDSTQLVFNGSTGLLLPVAAGRQMRFELALIKTNYTGGGGSYFGITLPDSVQFSSDTTFYSVHFVAVGTSPRRYWLRIYETRADALSGLAPNLVDATKRMIFQIELDPLTTGYFPPTTTSFQFRITLRVRWQI